MFKNIKLTARSIFSVIIILFLFVVLFSSVATASPFEDALRNTASQTNGYDQEIPLQNYAASIVKSLLTLVGIIFVALLIYGGYLYMTAMGADDKVTKAKKTMTAAVVGLIIIISGYSITAFITSTLENPGAGMRPEFREECEISGTSNYNSVNCCEYRYQVFNHLDTACCYSLCNKYPNECTEILGQPCP